MDKFRTEVLPPLSPIRIGLGTPILTMGSCFADAIGARLVRYKFACRANPFGVIYNPLSIHKTLSYALHDEKPPAETYVQNGEVWYNYDFHSSLSALSHPALEAALAAEISGSAQFLQTASILLITYGTSWVYQRNDNDALVANCHKVPAAAFSKRLLTDEEICKSFEEAYNLLKPMIPDVKVILTVSPVRHVKDTLPLNSVSKAVLRVACHNLASRFDDVEYFPAFEMMVDDLRDYRFYGRDMIHPTEEAEDYIWNKFSHTYFDAETRAFMEEWDEILAAINHRPFHPGTQAHQAFLRRTLERLRHLASTVDVRAEIDSVAERLLP